MKILFCTNVFREVSNGPIKFANELLELNTLYPQHEVRVLTEDEAAPFLYQVKISRFWRKSSFSQFVRMWSYHRAAMKIRRLFAFDVLVYNHALVGLVSAYRFPGTVVMLNDYKNLGEGLSTFRPSRLWFKRVVFRLAELHTLRNAKRVIVNSDYLRTRVINAYSIPREKVFRLYKGVDIPKQIVPAKALHRPIRVLFCKNDFIIGGLPFLIQALNLLSVAVELRIAGTDPEADPAIDQMHQGSGKVSLSILHKITQCEVRKHLLWCDIFCVPSLCEALGVANLEAMAMGKPVISTHVGGIVETLDHGRAGWLVPPGNAEQLAAAFETCISNHDERLRKTLHARDYVRRFSLSDTLHGFVQICQL